MQDQTADPDLVCIRKHKRALELAIENNRSAKWVLRLWSRYIKARDAHRCVLCPLAVKIQAHHIVRRTLYPWGAFETGNGITLCGECHNRIHARSNLKADLSQPLGEGDDQDDWAYLFRALCEDADLRGLDHNEFYYIPDHMVNFSVNVQGYEYLREMLIRGEISRIRFAFEIWRYMPETFYKNTVAQLFRLNM